MIFVFRFWKSCVPRKGTEGSNPSLCAKARIRAHLAPFLHANRARFLKAPAQGAFFVCSV